MGAIKTIRGEDGRPYVLLESIIKEISDLKKTTYDSELIDNNKLLDAILETLNDMEEQYYNNYIFKKR
jgi:hypothetical protein